MGENSGIQWTTHTFNPWVGCQRVSPGCEHCYAEAYDKRVGGAKLPDGSKALRWGPKAPRVRTSPANWRKPLAWDRAARAADRRDRVFCSSLADVFEDRPELVPWRAELFALIARTPSLDWLLLTKRPENIRRLWPEVEFPDGQRCFRPGVDWWPNVWLGTTVEDQRRANERIPELVQVPAAVRFLSCEPLLERLDLRRWLDEDETGFVSLIDWVIIGGESGPAARPFAIEWARSLIAQCRDGGDAEAAPFMKQLGARPVAPVPMRLDDSHGGDPSEWPADLRVREFPEPRR